MEFFWIGIWFNFSLKVKLKTLFPDGVGNFKYWFSDGIGMFDFSAEAYNKIVIISCLSYIAIITASFFRNSFLVIVTIIVMKLKLNSIRKTELKLFYFF